MKRYILITATGLFLASCTMNVLKQHAGPTPPEEGCGHCHYLVYKDWKVTYKPYEQIPLPGDTQTPVNIQQYHERRGKEAIEGTTVMPARKDCTVCHAGAESPKGSCTRDRQGFK